MTPLTLILYDVAALLWLMLVGYAGWRYYTSGARRAWTLPLVALLQSIVAGYVILFLGIVPYQRPLPPGPDWLSLPGEVIFAVLTFPITLAERLLQAGTLDPFLAGPFYAPIFLLIDLLAYRRQRL